jgi:hypothetical protein
VNPNPIVERINKDIFGEDNNLKKQDWDDSPAHKTPKYHGEDSARRTLNAASPYKPISPSKKS